MEILLHPRFARFVEEQVQSGRFATADEVINAALSRLQEDDLLRDDVEHLKSEIAVGLEEIAEGKIDDWDPDDIWAEVERRNDQERLDKKNAGCALGSFAQKRAEPILSRFSFTSAVTIDVPPSGC